MSLRNLSLGAGLLSLCFAPAYAATTNLFATHYGTKKVHTLQLTQSGDNYTLSETAALRTCGTYPRWITLDPETRTIYCTDRRGSRNIYETENATLSALSVEDDGSLTELASTANSPGGGVNSVVYNTAGGKFLAVANSLYAAVSTFALPLKADAYPAQLIEFDLNAQGSVPELQGSPRPHETVLDPTGSFIVVPDLSADLLRVFAIDNQSGHLNACPSFNYTLGGGPAHGVFYTAPKNQTMGFRVQGEKTLLYVAGESNGEVEAFAVSYTEGCPSFKQVGAEVPYPGDELPEGASLGEIRRVGEDLYVSIRPDEDSDDHGSISRLSRTRGGKIEFAEITSSEGVYPHTFVVNKAGTLVAVGNRISSNLVIIERDPATGVLGDVVADLVVGEPGYAQTLSGLSSVIWDE